MCCAHIIYSGTFIISLSLFSLLNRCDGPKILIAKKSWTGVSIRCDVLERGTHHQTIVHTKVHTSWTKGMYLFLGARREKGTKMWEFWDETLFFFSSSVVLKRETYFIVSNIKMSFLVFQETKLIFNFSPLFFFLPVAGRPNTFF